MIPACQTHLPNELRSSFHTQRIAVFVLFAVFSLTGCASRSWNEPIAAKDMSGDYNLVGHHAAGNAKDVFVILAFSGGGMRSAAFSYGTLKALRDINVTIHGQKRSLLDEVDVISSVSGGSYTAAYYGLFGQRIFKDYERNFLLRDVEGEMLGTLLNPINTISLASSDYNRGDLAASWLDNNVFEHRTFSSMSQNGLPYVILNASDLNTGMTFSFMQQQFDFLCSDLNSYPVSNAVMASSAVPGLFAPIALHNFDENCAQRRQPWIFSALKAGSTKDRNYDVARELEQYFEPGNMPTIRLVDGGVTDNLGVRGSIMSPALHYGHVTRMAGAFTPKELDDIVDVLVIVANAQVYKPFDWSEAGEEPGLIDTVYAAFDASLNLLNSETIQQAQRSFEAWADEVNARRAPRAAKVRVHFVSLTFDDIQDRSERQKFNAIPTNLSLTPEQVKSVESLPATLLASSQEFQKFLLTLP